MPDVLAEELVAPQRLRLAFFAFDETTLVEQAVDALLTALARFQGKPEAAGVWPAVVAQVRSPRTARRKGAPIELYDPALVRTLEALDPGHPAG